jgi:transposase InsO family protein
MTMGAATLTERQLLLRRIWASSAVLLPPEAPESDGMAEAFVKTFKRDYIYIHDRPDAKTVMAQLDQWSEDYNDTILTRGSR